MKHANAFGAWILAACAALVLAGCGGPAGPFNLSANEKSNRLMLEGHDAVAYFSQGRNVKGSAEFSAEHEGVTYWFTSAANAAEFKLAPAKYAPQFGGFCTNGIVYGIPWGGDADTFKIIDGKLYIFGGKASRDYFSMDEKVNLERAHKMWREEVAGNHALPQRYKRLVLRVPHYKTGAQLADEWKAHQGKASGK
ncbi:MAG: YHS domain-containing protein [Betaproteobacteria bacterium]|nr:YHS domain-containing protein [Betaproteobacteria bacterium]